MKARFAAALVLVASLAGAAEPPIAPGHGDAALVAQLQREGRVDTAVPQPGLRDWAAALMRGLGRWVWSLVPGVPWLRSGRVWQGIGYAALALAALAAAWLAWQGLVRWMSRSGVRPEPDVSSTSERAATPRGAATWRAVVEEELAAGRARAALGALWWWVAESLLGGRVEPSWTSRQLVAEARRPDLRPALGALDGMLYGPDEVGTDQVSRLARDLGERVT